MTDVTFTFWKYYFVGNVSSELEAELGSELGGQLGNHCISKQLIMKSSFVTANRKNWAYLNKILELESTGVGTN